MYQIPPRYVIPQNTESGIPTADYSKGPAGPATAEGGTEGARPGARQEVVAVTPLPEAQTSCCGGPKIVAIATGEGPRK